MQKTNKVLVINGSPKGEFSVTLQTIRYLEVVFDNLEIDIVNVGAKLKYFENNFSIVQDKLSAADLVVFSYPVYTFIAPWQLHRFIEICKEKGLDCTGKFATQITTSKHFYDYTAHKYIEDNANDLGFKFIRGLSADMDDLTTKKGQKEAVDFMKYVMFSMKNDIYEKNAFDYALPKHIPVKKQDAVLQEKPGDIVILTTCDACDTQLKDMIDLFSQVATRKTRVINLRQFPFQGGCRGCFHCAPNGECIYKDGFQELLREDIQKADAIVMAFSIKDHSMGAAFKLYDDRQFCNGHRTVTMGMPMGYIVSGDLSKEQNLQLIIEGRASVGGNYLAGVATDEFDPECAIKDLAKNLEYALQNKYVPPQNFLGVGGMKIFRDLIYQMKGMMRADHKFYKAHGQYDFPQKHKGRIVAMYLVGALMSNKKLMQKAGNNVNEGMLLPYKKVIEKARLKDKR